MIGGRHVGRTVAGLDGRGGGHLEHAGVPVVVRFVRIGRVVVGGGKAGAALKRAETVDDLQQRVVYCLESAGVALVGLARQAVQGLQVLGQAGDRAGAAFLLRDFPERFLGGAARRLDQRLAAAGDRLLDHVQTRRDLVEVGGGLVRRLQLPRQGGNLGLQRAHDVGVQPRRPGYRLLDAPRDVVEPILEVAHLLRVAAIRGQPVVEFCKPRIDRLQHFVVGGGLTALSVVEPLRDFPQPPLQFVEQRLALLHGVALALLEHTRQMIEALVDAAQQLVRVGALRRGFQLGGDDRHLVGEALHQRLGYLDALGDVVDTLRQIVQAVEHLRGRPTVGEFLHLAGERGEARLDTLERLGVDLRGTRGLSPGGDRPRNLVEPLFHRGHRLGGGGGTALHEAVERHGERADVFFQRAQRKRPRQVGDGVLDLLQPLNEAVERLRPGVGGGGRDTVLEGVPPAVEIVPPTIDGAHAVLARQLVQRRLYLFEFQAQQVDAAFVAALGERVDGIGKSFEFTAEFVAGRTAGGDGPDVVAQFLEFAMQRSLHLLAQFLAHRLQLGGNLAGRGQAVILASQALDVAGKGAVRRLAYIRLAGLARQALHARRDVAHRIGGFTHGLRGRLDAALDILERLVQPLQRCRGAAASAGIE